MRTILLASATAAAMTLGFAAPAMAQDAPQAPFTGLRMEGLIGYDSLKNGSDRDSESSDGLLYGAAIGYDVQAGPVVVGAEAEISGSTADTRNDNVLVLGDTYRLDAGRDLYAGARVGYVISPMAMAYAKAGYTNARLEETYDVGSTRINDHVNLDGFRVGAGLEYKLSGNTYVKGEYRYSHYGQTDGYDIDIDRHQLMGGVGLRF